MSTQTAGIVAEFHAASREALSATRHRLSESTSEASSDDLVTVADQLDAVGDLLGREAVLRRTLADSSRSAEDREGLASRLVDQQVSTTTADVVRAAVSSQWSRPEDLVDGLRIVAREALLISAERDGRLDTVEDELFRLGRIVGVSPTSSGSSPTRPPTPTASSRCSTGCSPTGPSPSPGSSPGSWWPTRWVTASRRGSSAWPSSRPTAGNARWPPCGRQRR